MEKAKPIEKAEPIKQEKDNDLEVMELDSIEDFDDKKKNVVTKK